MANNLSMYSTEELETELKRRKMKSNHTKAKKYASTMSDDELDELENIEFNKLKKMGR